MSLESLRRSPWLAGALVLALVAGLVAPLALWLGPRRWPLLVGGAVLLLLFLGWLERLWKSRPLPRLPRLHRVAGRRRFRVVPGGKGNGHAHDTPDDDGDEPRWVM